MALVRHLTSLDPTYPSRLRRLRAPPALSVSGGSLEAETVLAVVGSREADDGARGYAAELAARLVFAGAVVVSGGAIGVDAAAHRGALRAGGRTWAIAGSGCAHCFPRHHAPLFARIAEGPGTMVWPFAPGEPARPANFLARNRILVALADAVLVVQAGFKSGALHSAGCALRFAKPLWVVPAPLWLESYAGSVALLREGARPLFDEALLFESLGLPPPAPADKRAGGIHKKAAAPTRPTRQTHPARATRPATASLTPAELAVWESMTHAPSHVDEIATRAGAAVEVASAALLTLALENVVVEGPLGFFRRA
jgi:DNA processing protein